MSVVYFLQVEGSGPVKIGTTIGNVHLRVQSLQQASPYELRWIGYFPGGRTEEKAAHQLLSGSRLRGEWFYPTAEVVAFVKEKCPDFCPDKARDDLFFEKERQIVIKLLPPYKRPIEVAWPFAKEAGFRDIYRFWRWLDRGQAPTAEQAKRAAECALARLNGETMQ
jgi:hypothetical protein